MPWILCGPGVPLVSSGRVGGLDGDDLRAGDALLEHLADAGDRAARADAGDEVVDLAVGVADDLLGGGLAVDLGVRLVLELPGEDRAGGLGDDLLGLRDGALHAAGGSVSTSSAP